MTFDCWGSDRKIIAIYHLSYVLDNYLRWIELVIIDELESWLECGNFPELSVVSFVFFPNYTVLSLYAGGWQVHHVPNAVLNNWRSCN